MRNDREIKKFIKQMAKENNLTYELINPKGRHGRVLFKSFSGKERFFVLSTSPSTGRSFSNEKRGIKRIIDNLCREAE